MQDIKGCIFDLDGVIVDTAKYHFLAWRKMANALGFDFSEVQNEELKGVGRMDSLDIILGWGGVSLGEADKEAWAERKNAWYRDLISSMDASEILPEVTPFLEALKAAGIKIALGSSSKNAGTIIDRIGLRPLFDAHVDGNDITRSKPDPQIFQIAAERLGLHPADCLVFEDARSGIEAAQAAGMRTVGIGHAEVLDSADIVIPGFVGQHPAALFERLG